jgi:hypothetical protein
MMKSRRFIQSHQRSEIRCLLPLHTLKFAFGLQPIIKLITWEATALNVDLICTEPDFFDARRMVCENIFSARPNRTIG